MNRYYVAITVEEIEDDIIRHAVSRRSECFDTEDEADCLADTLANIAWKESQS